MRSAVGRGKPAAGHPSRSASSDCLSNVSQQIEYEQCNPKKRGSAAASRYDSYKRARTIGEALNSGALPGDLKNDLSKGYLRIIVLADGAEPVQQRVRPSEPSASSRVPHEQQSSAFAPRSSDQTLGNPPQISNPREKERPDAEQLAFGVSPPRAKDVASINAAISSALTDREALTSSGPAVLRRSLLHRIEERVGVSSIVVPSSSSSSSVAPRMAHSTEVSASAFSSNAASFCHTVQAKVEAEAYVREMPQRRTPAATDTSLHRSPTPKAKLNVEDVSLLELRGTLRDSAQTSHHNNQTGDVIDACISSDQARDDVRANAPALTEHHYAGNNVSLSDSACPFASADDESGVSDSDLVFACEALESSWRDDIEKRPQVSSSSSMETAHASRAHAAGDGTLAWPTMLDSSESRSHLMCVQSTRGLVTSHAEIEGSSDSKAQMQLKHPQTDAHGCSAFVSSELPPSPASTVQEPSPSAIEDEASAFFTRGEEAPASELCPEPDSVHDEADGDADTITLRLRLGIVRVKLEPSDGNQAQSSKTSPSLAASNIVEQTQPFACGGAASSVVAEKDLRHFFSRRSPGDDAVSGDAAAHLAREAEEPLRDSQQEAQQFEAAQLVSYESNASERQAREARDRELVLQGDLSPLEALDGSLMEALLLGEGIFYWLESSDNRQLLYRYVELRARAIRWYKAPAESFFAAQRQQIDELLERPDVVHVFTRFLQEQTDRIEAGMFEMPELGSFVPKMFVPEESRSTAGSIVDLE